VNIAISTHQRSLKRTLWLTPALAAVLVATAIAVTPNNQKPSSELIIEQLDLEGAKALSSDATSYVLEERIRAGETLGGLISRLGIRDPAAISYLNSAPEARAIAEQLAPGKTVTSETTANGELLSLHFPLNDRRQALIIGRVEGELKAGTVGETFEKIVITKAGIINSSLFAATDAMDIPDAITMQMVEIFSADIDFHRDLRKGDRFTISYEVEHSRGRQAQPGRVLGAEFVNGDKTYRALWFAHDSKGGYYTEDGSPLKKSFLRSPLEFSRVTSGFSRRFHPILKEWRAHNGVDYGAPSGTKVRATADATVEFAGSQRGYGNIVILKHAGQHTTAYAHLRGFAKGIRKGSRVEQGETIGYVGSTGWATGPHLHYEFRINGTPTDPLTSKMASGTPLNARQLQMFRTAIAPTSQRIEAFAQVDANLID
jgi:murein DD-endopeptidase MepM/ murein hydrolase activator NlpD